MRVLIGGVGYRNLRDHSLGPWLADRLSAQARDGIEVEDVSYHPIGLSQNLQERPVYDRVVLVGAVARGRQPGTIVAYRWRGELPAPAEVQARVAEAVTGVISLDNLLAVVGTFGGFPGDVRVVVPALMVEIHEPYAPLDQAAGQQAVVGERRPARLGAVHLEDMARLP